MREEKQQSTTISSLGLMLWAGGLCIFALGLYSKKPTLLLGLFVAALAVWPLSLGKHIERGRSFASFFLTWNGVVATVCAVAALASIGMASSLDIHY